MNRIAISPLVLAMLFWSTQALPIAPKADSAYDYRIKTVNYNPNDTVVLNAVIGIQIHIVVDNDEKYVTHAFGDTKAWEFAHTDNHYFIRPKADLSDTNLTIVTDKRTYNILLHFIGHYPKKEADGSVQQAYIMNPWSMKQAAVQLTYLYPDEQVAKAKAAVSAAKLKQAMDAKNMTAPHNIAYQMSADPASASIAPINTWDDFRFTYFKFPANAELPTVFVISSDGKESTVNTHIEGPDHNIIVAETTAKSWRVRYGLKKVVGIVNDAYDPTRGANAAGTSIPGFQRVLKSGDQATEDQQ